MTRVPALAAADVPEEIARVYAAATARFGKLPEPLAVTAHDPGLFRAYVGFERAIAQAGRVDARLKALASLKAAALIGCPFCMDIGSAEARAHGIAEDELRALPNHRESALFSLGIGAQGFSKGAYCVRPEAPPA